MPGNPVLRERHNRLRQIALRYPDAEWRAMSELERIKAMFGMNLDDMHKLCSIPWEDADLHEKNMKVQVFITLMKTGIQLFERRERDGFRQQVLENLGEIIKEHKSGRRGRPSRK